MHLFANIDILTGLFLVALALTIVILLRRSHRYFSRQKRDQSPIVETARPVRQDPGHHLDAPPEVLRWEVQMHETARELSAQLDSKMSALQALIAEADRAAARLEGAAGESPAAPGPDPQPADQADALKPPQSDEPPETTAETPATDVLQRPSTRQRQEEIYTLADYGLDAAEIAGRLGSPIGEVELILGLRDKQ